MDNKEDLEKIEIPSFWKSEYDNFKKIVKNISFYFSKREVFKRAKNIKKIAKANEKKEKGTFKTAIDVVKEAGKISRKDFLVCLGYQTGMAVFDGLRPMVQKMLFGSLTGLAAGNTIPFFGASALGVLRNRLSAFCQYKGKVAKIILDNTYRNSAQNLVYSDTLHKPRPYFKVNAPDAIEKATLRMANLKNDILGSSMRLGSSAIVWGISTASLFAASPTLALCVVGCTAGIKMVGTKFNKLYRDVFDKANQNQANVSKNNIDSIKNTPLIQATNKVQNETLKIKNRLDNNSENVSRIENSVANINLGLGSSVNILMELGIAVVAAYDVMKTGDIGRFALINSAAWQMMQNGSNITGLWSNLQQTTMKLHDSAKKLMTPRGLEITRGKEILSKEDTTVKIKNVSFAYPDVSKDITKLTREEAEKQLNEVTRGSGILHDVNLEFDRGKLNVIVGETGNGKSTLLSLMRHDYDTEAGEILIGDKNINDIEESSFNSHVALVDQNVHFFDRSIRDNLLYFKDDATEEELIDVCKKVGFYEDVVRLGTPKKEDDKKEDKNKDDDKKKMTKEEEAECFKRGLDYQIGQDGALLSGGQRQRVALARVVLSDSHIVLMDEPTTGLDGNKTNEIIRLMKNLAKSGKTVVVVTHNPTEIALADRCVIISGGKVVADGKPEKLMDTDYMKGVLTERELEEKKTIYNKSVGEYHYERDVARLYEKENQRPLTDDERNIKLELIKKHKNAWKIVKSSRLKNRENSGKPVPEKRKREPLNPAPAFISDKVVDVAKDNR